MESGETNCGDIPPEEVKRIEDRARAKDITRECIKCKSAKAVILFRRDSTCWDCFEYLFIRKFKTGLNVSRKEDLHQGLFKQNVTIRSMIQLMAECIAARESKDDTFYTISVLHIDEGTAIGLSEQERKEKNDTISRICSSYSFPLQIVPLEDAFRLSEQNFIKWEESDSANSEKIQKLFKETSSNTSKEDLILHLRTSLILHFAKSRGLEKVLLGYTASRLTINLISNTCKGKGFIVSEELAGMDKKYNEPLKDILAKEVAIYNRYKKLETIVPRALDTKSNPKFSIDHITENFIEGLQVEFPHTIHTVLRAGAKLCLPEKKDFGLVCALCTGSLSPEEVAHLSKPNSSGCENCNCSTPSSCKSEKIDLKNNLCYGCKKILEETSQETIPPFVFERAEKVQVAVKSSRLRDQIKDFLLDDSV